MMSVEHPAYNAAQPLTRALPSRRTDRGLFSAQSTL